MIVEILANIGLTMAGFFGGMPNEERINRNLEMLKSTDWFQSIYQKNENFFLKDDMVRYMIGLTNVERSLKSEKRTNRLKKKILDTLNDR